MCDLILTDLYCILYAAISCKHHIAEHIAGADPEILSLGGGGGGVRTKIAPSGGRREIFWGISCEKSRFYDATVCIHFRYDDPLSCRKLFINVRQRIIEISQFWSRVYGFIVLLTRGCINQASLVWRNVKEGRSFEHVIFAE